MMLKSSVRGFLVKVRGYVRENWGAPFVLAFMGLLLVAVVLLILGLPWTAEVVGNYAYFSLVVGVVLQLVCSWRRGDGHCESEDGAGT
jgi:hypothetical protein